MITWDNSSEKVVFSTKIYGVPIICKSDGYIPVILSQIPNISMKLKFSSAVGYPIVKL